MKDVVAAFNQEEALVGAFSVITNLRMELFQALEHSHTNHRIPHDSHWEMCQMCRLLHVTCKCVLVGGTVGVKKGSKLLSKNLEKANQLLEVKAALEQLSIEGTYTYF